MTACDFNPRKVRAKALVAVLAVVAAAVTLAQPAAATSPTGASGSIAAAPTSVTVVRVADGNTFLHVLIAGTLSGTFTGPFIDDIDVVFHPDGALDAHHVVTCTCTVAGLSGTVVFRGVAKGVAGPPITLEDHLVLISGTAGLANLHAELTALQPAGTYSGTYHFDP